MTSFTQLLEKDKSKTDKNADEYIKFIVEGTKRIENVNK